MGRASSADVAALEFDISCDLSQSRPAGERIRRFLLEHGRSEADAIDAELATVEACNNAAKYVQGEANLLPIKVRAVLKPSELLIEVIDHTPGFDWPEKAVLPDPNAESGRGIFLIRAVMQHTEYIRGAGENRLIMRRHLS